MSWESYIAQLMAPEPNGFLSAEQAAICGFEKDKESVWASTPNFSITLDEIKKLADKNRSSFLQDGVHIGGIKCRLLRDQLDEVDSYCMQLKTVADTAGHTHGMCVGKTGKALLILKGTPDAVGGQLYNKVFKMVEFLRKNNS